MSNRTLVIGLGTGRCGTLSLTSVLNEQFLNVGVEITHERPPLLRWRASKLEVVRHLERLSSNDTKVFGDVGFFYLPHIETIIEWAERKQLALRFICLRRQRNETICSYLKKVAPYNANHWMTHSGEVWTHSPMWDPMYPKLDHCHTLEEALGVYWDMYYAEAEQWANKTPEKFCLFELDNLNSRDALCSLLDFVFPLDGRLIASVKTRLNTTCSRVTGVNPDRSR